MATGQVPIVWVEAHGANVVDADGNVYIDLTGAFGVATLGHNHPRVQAAIRDQTRRLTHALSDVHPSDIRVRLAERIAALAPVDDGQVIFANTGAEAVELAIKTSTRATGRHGIIAFNGAYHGVTYGALAVTSRDDFRQPYEPQIYQGVVHVPYPNPSRYPERSIDEWLRPVAEALAEPPVLVGPIAGVIVEPVQGRGGEIVPPPGFLSRLQDLCRQHGALLIVDEMITGFGRTGTWFAVDHESVRPDVVCFGKAMAGGMPLSACVARRDVMKSWSYEEGEAPHASTFMGHPLSCAAALVAIDETERLKIPERAARLGSYALKRLSALRRRCGGIVDVRGLGMMIGVELACGGPAVADACLKRGVIVLAGGEHGNVLALTPPITIARTQLDHALCVLEDALEEVLA